MNDHVNKMATTSPEILPFYRPTPDKTQSNQLWTEYHTGRLRDGIFINTLPELIANTTGHRRAKLFISGRYALKVAVAVARQLTGSSVIGVPAVSTCASISRAVGSARICYDFDFFGRILPSKDPVIIASFFGSDIPGTSTRSEGQFCISDEAQSFMLSAGRTGLMPQISVFSFGPTKGFDSDGGGAIATSDMDIWEEVFALLQQETAGGG
jgi:dTDP-4-amino-4,6-dideoxygalactose transaminase